MKRVSIIIETNSEERINEIYLHREVNIAFGNKVYHYYSPADAARIYGPYSFGAKLARERKFVALVVTESGEIYAAAKKGTQIEKLTPQPEGFPIRPQ